MSDQVEMVRKRLPEVDQAEEKRRRERRNERRNERRRERYKEVREKRLQEVQEYFKNLVVELD